MTDNDPVLENELATRVIGIAIDPHSQSGLGLLEKADKQVLAYQLQKAGIFVEVEKKMPLVIDDINLDVGNCIHILEVRKLVLELKSVEILIDARFAQAINYVKLGIFNWVCLLTLMFPAITMEFKELPIQNPKFN